MKLPAILSRCTVRKELQSSVFLDGKLVNFFLYNPEDIKGEMLHLACSRYGTGCPVMVEVNPADQFCKVIFNEG